MLTVDNEMSEIQESAMPRLLVVEDDTEMLELMQNMLTQIRCRVLIARSGEEALAVLHREQTEGREVDLVLLDDSSGFTCWTLGVVTSSGRDTRGDFSSSRTS